MDVHEDSESNTVTATFGLPDLNKGDLQIDVRNGRLSISGETKQRAVMLCANESMASVLERCTFPGVSR